MASSTMPERCWRSRPHRDVAALALAIRPLTTVASFMNVGAHPDDELSALLAFCSRGLGVRTISVIATRGEGGQNLLGAERDQALGLLRTRELEEASKVTGAKLRLLSEDFDDPIFDFGFSRDPDETLSRWGAQRTLERLVRVLREERPDVVMTSFRDEYGQHGHHRAITRLTVQAVRLAADPTVFPDHIGGGLKPWSVKKLYIPANPHKEAGDVYLSTEAGNPTLVVDVGTVDDVLGISYLELGEASRLLHRSQGMGRPVLPGSHRLYAELVYSAVEGQRATAADGLGRPERWFFEGLPYTVADLATILPDGHADVARALLRVQQGVDAIAAAFPHRSDVLKAVHRTLADVRALLENLDESGLPQPVADELRFRLALKERQLVEASAIAALLIARIDADRYEVAQGQAITLQGSVYNGGHQPLANVRIELHAPPGWSIEVVDRRAAPPAGETAPTLGRHETVGRAFRLNVPSDAPYFHPYRAPLVTGIVRYEVDGVEAAVPVEPPRAIAVLPDLSLAIQPEALLVNTAEPGRRLSVAVLVRNHSKGAVEALVRLTGPERWDVAPAEVPVRVGPGAVQRVSFTVLPPHDVIPGRYALQATAEFRGKRFGHRVRAIEYPHIGRTYMLTPANIPCVALPLKIAPVRVGYVDGGFDSVAGHLQQMGFHVTLLGQEDLLWGDLGRYDTIVVGVYAYSTRVDLRAANDRLLEYVRRGGHLIVQLHRPQDNWDPDRLPPYRLVIGRPSFNWRVTDPAAPVSVLEPASPIFNWPNRVEDDDWSGWVKERGLYFPMDWGPEFTPLVAMRDPGRPTLKGGMLLARPGKGSYLFTSLTWHYQLDHQVPGAFRIMANMVSLPAFEKHANLTAL